MIKPYILCMSFGLEALHHVCVFWTNNPTSFRWPCPEDLYPLDVRDLESLHPLDVFS